MPMVCNESGCEYVPGAKPSPALEPIYEMPLPSQSSDDESTSTAGSSNVEGGTLLADDGECAVGGDTWEKESKRYLLQDELLVSNSPSNSKTSIGCWPKKCDATTCTPIDYNGLDDSTMAGRQAYVVYNPFVVDYVSKLRSEKTPSEEVLKILRHMIYAIGVDPGHRTSIGFHGGVSAVLECMEHNQAEHKILEKSCHLLGILCNRNADLQFKVSASYGVTRILAAMDSSAKNRPSLHREACFALRQVMDLSENIAQFILSRGVGRLIKTMKQFSKHRVIQLHSTSILRRLSESEVECMGYSDVVGVTVCAMRQFKKINDIQINGCAVLYAIARERKLESQISLLSNNVIVLLLACMKDNMDIAVIQCQCCAALGYMAQNHAVARDAMVNDGAVSIIWDVMKYHATNQDVKNEGGKALRFLSQGPTGSAAPETNIFDEAKCIEYECY